MTLPAMRSADKDPQTHPQERDEGTAPDSHNFRGVCPENGIRREWMSNCTGKPDESSIPSDAKKRCYSEASDFARRGTLAVFKCPILIQQETIRCANAISQDRVYQDQQSVPCRKQEE